MAARFWVKRFVLALVLAGGLLFGVELVKGHEPTGALRFAILWGALSASLFTLVGYVRYRRNPACMVPRSR